MPLIILVFWFLKQPNVLDKHVDVSYNQFKEFLQTDRVVEVTLQGNEIKAVLKQAVSLSEGRLLSLLVRTYIPEFGDDKLLPLMEKNQVMVKVKPLEKQNLLGIIVGGLLPWLLIIGFYVWFIRRLNRNGMGGIGGGGEISKFLNPNMDISSPTPDTTFDDVAGQDNAKNEITELLDYINCPEMYQNLGAEVPHGILLMGPPGTGKTLLARALAGEAGVPFCSISASEFIEMFVGVGAARVRALFKQAKERAPSIIFIDEIDAVGRTRGAGFGGGHDEREQTLNQILAEMDGFSGHEAVVVLAATNRPDVLDPALLRPGRFDRHITLDLPDRSARRAILKVHTRKSPLATDVDLEKIASGTPGFSGADLKNLVNEAAMRTARKKRTQITMEDFDQMRDKVLFGNKRNLAIQPDEVHRLAVHEAGHTAAAYYLPQADPLFKVSIIPRGKALGATQQLPGAERYTLSKTYLCDRLAVMLAGRVAERIFLIDISSGADDDIHQATALARSMVTRWGMSEEVGPMDCRESDEHPFLGREVAQPRLHSESSAQKIDNAVRNILLTAEKRVESIILEYRLPVEQLIHLLKEKETLYQPEIAECLSIDMSKVTQVKDSVGKKVKK
ncbi:cell division protein FtsH [Candidatus Endobugula sertula]|uniref:ATP-dependent zinc metalloprotease FtsH n=1 Tax=Candidatus Endobugula sertula TaxID=62101 RepID=A0A1D2QTR6_9GAMM|nr:cell division protein FtsH [Candidatus Endobugula sertula]